MALQTLPFKPEEALQQWLPNVEYGREKYRALFFEAGNVCLIALRKGLKSGALDVTEFHAHAHALKADILPYQTCVTCLQR